MKQALALVGVLIAVGLALAYWKLLAALVIVGLLVWGGYRAGTVLLAKRQDRINGQTARRSALAARAEFQNQQYLAGEDRGMYGTYRPESLD
ncbi:hypothetical protein [Prescottella equi]|uniref:hypothetical protein n=1 Tax=Rhodococcus hoagii TaxID=43767 RepID=UPI000A10AC2D|nr:hypothetical protein [Prescottella equi]ORJ99891.1 hypothetical protein A6F58_00865 [Prescottella equi]